MSSYYELWNLMSQWKEDFTVKEFASTFASPDHNKVLHDMSRKGLLEKTGWGKYRVVPQNAYVKRKVDISNAYDIVKKAGLPYAFTRADAVFIWTKGGYNADRSFASYPIIMKVKHKDLSRWKKFFRSEKRKFTVEGRPLKETLYGVFYTLQPVEKIRKTQVEGYNVEPLNETVKFCKDKEYTYEPALEMLDEMYGLGLGTNYREHK